MSCLFCYDQYMCGEPDIAVDYCPRGGKALLGLGKILTGAKVSKIVNNWFYDNKIAQWDIAFQQSNWNFWKIFHCVKKNMQWISFIVEGTTIISIGALCGENSIPVILNIKGLVQVMLLPPHGSEISKGI